MIAGRWYRFVTDIPFHTRRGQKFRYFRDSAIRNDKHQIVAAGMWEDGNSIYSFADENGVVDHSKDELCDPPEIDPPFPDGEAVRALALLPASN